MTETDTPATTHSVDECTPSVSTPLNRRDRTDMRDTQGVLQAFAAQLHEQAKGVEKWTTHTEQGKREHWTKQGHGKVYNRLCQHVTDLLAAADIYPKELLQEVLVGPTGTAEERVAAELKAQRMMGRGSMFTTEELVKGCIEGDAGARVVLEEYVARGQVAEEAVLAFLESKHEEYAAAMRARHGVYSFVNGVFRPFLADLAGMVGNPHVAAVSPAFMPVNIAQALGGKSLEVVGVRPVKL